MQALSRLALLRPAFRLLHCTHGSGLHCESHMTIVCTAFPPPACSAPGGRPAFALLSRPQPALLIPQIHHLHCTPASGLHCSPHKSIIRTAPPPNLHYSSHKSCFRTAHAQRPPRHPQKTKQGVPPTAPLSLINIPNRLPSRLAERAIAPLLTTPRLTAPSSQRALRRIPTSPGPPPPHCKRLSSHR